MRISIPIAFLLVSISIACTGYAVYADKTWSGFVKNRSAPVCGDGITVPELRKWK